MDNELDESNLAKRVSAAAFIIGAMAVGLHGEPARKEAFEQHNITVYGKPYPTTHDIVKHTLLNTLKKRREVKNTEPSIVKNVKR